MNGPSGINQWPNVDAAAFANRAKRVIAQDSEERLMLTRLFGQKEQPAPNQPAEDNDEFAPHLGRYVDVIA